MATLLSKGSLLGSALKTQIVSAPQAKNLAPSGQSMNAANLKDIKIRIKSVQSIRKITKTMNMIATARLKAAQNKMEKSRVFFATVSRALEAVPPVTSAKKTLIVPISSDRGLCGAVNSQVVKTVKHNVKDFESKGSQVSMICVGEKGPTILSRDQGSKILWHAGETARKSINFLAAGVLAERILKTDFDVASITYNKFQSIISYVPTTTEVPSYNTLVEKLDAFGEYEFEDDNNLFHLQDLTEYYLTSVLFASFSDASTSELGGRMSSMDNATRNAGDMIKRYTIEYNRKRQAAITTELNEIISGASAIQ
jgi:F-type H+-transporting ATPase subunit gamma